MQSRDSDASSQITVVAGGDAARLRSKPAPLTGTTLGHFRIVELLGRGAWAWCTARSTSGCKRP
jgi:hypothetical protein